MSQRPPLKKNPTAKQRKAAEILSESIRNEEPKALGQVLQEAGYSESTSESPTLVTQSKGFQAIMEAQGITDDTLAEVLHEGLGAMNYIKTERVEGVGKGRLKTEEIKEVPDINTRHKFLETGLRLKGHGKVAASPSYNFFNQVADKVRNEFSATESV